MVPIVVTVCSLLCQRANRRKQRMPYQPASTAGEAIERMLVEKRISSKINYDVLRDLDKGFGSDDSTTAGTSIIPQVDESLASSLTGLSSSVPTVPPVPVGDASSLSITRMPSTGGGRLPSLSTRKRTLSSLGGLSMYGRSTTK